MSKKVGLAVIGSGRIAYSHLTAISSLKNKAELIAAVGIMEEVAREAALKFEAKRYYTKKIVKALRRRLIVIKPFNKRGEK